MQFSCLGLVLGFGAFRMLSVQESDVLRVVMDVRKRSGR